MGRNQKWVLEDNLSEGCLEDNPEGSTTSISAVVAVSTQRVSREMRSTGCGESEWVKQAT